MGVGHYGVNLEGFEIINTFYLLSLYKVRTESTRDNVAELGM